MRKADQISIRAKYEHYKSTSDDRKIYTTLGFHAIGDELKVMYIADYVEDETIYMRPLVDFLGTVGADGVNRFVLVESNAISHEERDAILKNYEDDN